MIWVTLAFTLGIILSKLFSASLWFFVPTTIIFLCCTLLACYKKHNLIIYILILACLAGGINYAVRGKETQSNFSSPTSPISESFSSVLHKILPTNEADLLGSILLGTSVAKLSDETKDTYRRAGLIHLLVVSGTQVSILIGVCLGITRLFNLPTWLGIIITTIFNIMLTIITGAGASILRAAIMGQITLLGLLFEREKEGYTALTFSAFILLIVNPSNLFDIGFQLSFAATWGLMYIAPLLAKHTGRMLAITIAPMLATTPLIAYYFSQISLGGIVANLLVLPWMEALVIFGFLTTLLGFLFLPLAQILGGTLWLLVFALNQLAEGIAGLPFASFYVRTPSVPIVAGYYVELIIVLEYLRREGKIIITRKRLVFAGLGLCLCLCLHFACSIQPSFGKCLTLAVIDVGEGDSIYIESPTGKNLLVDAGDKKMGKRGVISFLCQRGVRKINLMILTHLHEDHIGGVPAILQAVRVEHLLKPRELKVGTFINLGEGVAIQVLHANAFSENENDNSVVLRVCYQKFSALLEGDNEQAGEEEMLAHPLENLQSTVLKVGHHGSRTSTSPAFLEAVRPKFAIISCGRRNKFHHPHRSTLERLLQFCRVYRTDEAGTVVVKSDGERVEVGK